MSRRQPRGLETRARIMAAALDQFAERGYAAVSVGDIADAAGVTKGAVYYWFADKHDLGRDLQHDLYDRLTSRSLEALDPDGDAVTNMRRAFQVYLDALGSLGRARFFLRDAWTIPELDEGGRRDQRDAAALVGGVLRAAMARGEIVTLDPDALAHVLLGAFAEATIHVLTTGRRGPTVAVVDHLIESLRNHTNRTTPARPAAPGGRRTTGPRKGSPTR